MAINSIDTWASAIYSLNWELLGNNLNMLMFVSKNHDLLYYNRPVQKCNLSDPRRALVYGRFLGILFILSFCHREFFWFK
jgi:hypothetical protein